MWEEREFRALEPTGDSFPPRDPLGRGRGGAAFKGVGSSDALLTEYLEVARLGTSLHKAQRGTAEAWERGFFSF